MTRNPHAEIEVTGHPRFQYICQLITNLTGGIVGSQCDLKTKRKAPTAVPPDEAHDHFKRTLADSKWEVLRGNHVLRHSFISVLASEGVDRRVIDELVGHQSAAQRKRYRHPYPGVMQEAIKKVFG